MRKVIGILLAITYYIAFFAAYLYLSMRYEGWLLPALIRTIDLASAAIVLLSGVLMFLVLAFWEKEE